MNFLEFWNFGKLEVLVCFLLWTDGCLFGFRTLQAVRINGFLNAACRHNSTDDRQTQVSIATTASPRVVQFFAAYLA